MLLCPVRACHESLHDNGTRHACLNGHSFDVARSGYLNLLQPQERRSKTPGDSAGAVAARRRILDRGTEAPIVRGIVGRLALREGEALLDAGCGEGHHLEAFRQAYGVEAWGVDISVPAIDLAARRYRDCRWVVANADRFLPFEGGSFRAIVSINARMNAAEFHRLLAPDGLLLVAIPAADDLAELREAVQGERELRDRVLRTIETFAPHFTLRSQSTLHEVVHLDREAIADVMTSTYRGLRESERAKLDALDAMEVTLSRDVLLFVPNAGSLAPHHVPGSLAPHP